MLRLDHVAIARDHERVTCVGHQQQRFEAAQAAIAAPVLGEFDRRAREVAVLLQLRFEALLLVADDGHTFVISGNGDVIEPEHDLIAVGSGGPFAQAAGLALLQNTTLDARSITERSLGIAADICIYTIRNTTIAVLG